MGTRYSGPRGVRSTPPANSPYDIARGAHSRSSRDLSRGEKEAIWRALQAGQTAVELANDFDISISSVKNIAKRFVP